MPREVVLPDGSIAEFPDGMADADIIKVLQRKDVPRASEATKGMSSQAVQDFYAKTGTNVAQGLKDVGQTVAGAGAAIGIPGAQTVADQLAAQRQVYQANPASGDIAAQTGRMIGNAIPTLPIAAGTGLALRGIGAATGPIGEAVTNFLTGAGKGLGRLPSRAAAGALYGSETNALTGDSPAQGAGVGAALGLAGPAFGAVGRAAVGLFPAGRQRIANQLIAERAAGGPTAMDLREIVPGSTPTLAEATGNANIATLQRSALAGVDQNAAVEKAGVNAAARRELFSSVAGTPQDVEAATVARDAEANRQLSTLFQPGQQANPLPVIQKIDDILSGPGGKRDAVRTVLQNVRGKIASKDAQGNVTVETDPATLYQSVRKQIGDLLDKRSPDPAGQQAMRELSDVKDELDGVIEKAVPGFDQYLQDYSSASKPIDAMRYLQGLNLTDAKGNLTLSRVKNAIVNIGKQQQAPGYNQAKSLDTPHLEALQAIHDDLLRASNIDLARGSGSDTVQKAIAANRLLGNPLVTRLGHYAIGGLLGSGGAAHFGMDPVSIGAAGAAGMDVLGQLAARRNADIAQRVNNVLLNPSSFNPPASPFGNVSAQTAYPLAIPVQDLAINRLIAPNIMRRE
jgi:hypothetical protein